jgi:transcriptional regulator with XRE-family HTH domain
MEVPYLSGIENGKQDPTALTLHKIAERLINAVNELLMEYDTV